MNLIHISLIVAAITITLVALALFFNFSPTFIFINDLIRRQYVIYLFVVILFIILSYLYFKYKIQPKLNNKYIANKEFTDDQNSSNNDPANLYLFYTNWCPHCKNAWDPTDKIKRPWNQLKDELKKMKNRVNGKEIIVVEVDCEEDKNLAEEYKVEGYPTIKLQSDNKIYNYDAKPDKDQLIDFLNQVVQ